MKAFHYRCLWFWLYCIDAGWDRVTAALTNWRLRRSEGFNAQPARQNKCRQWAFLQSTDVLKLYTSFKDYCFNSCTFSLISKHLETCTASYNCVVFIWAWNTTHIQATTCMAPVYIARLYTGATALCHEQHCCSLGFSILPKDTWDQRNRTSDLPITRRWLYSWATVAHSLTHPDTWTSEQVDRQWLQNSCARLSGGLGLEKGHGLFK